MDSLRIEFLAPETADDPTAMSAIADLVNEVYAVAEEGLWIEGTTRTSAAEIAEFVREGEIAVARVDGRIVGCVRIQHLDEHLSEFGMLVASPRHRGLGIGRKLVWFAEHWSLDQHREAMQLELLVPREWTHPHKKFLAEWYTRLGYEVVRKEELGLMYPNLAPRLTCPCDHVIYRKDLRQ
jgi:GNAT superfamily N-acetyltransferase